MERSISFNNYFGIIFAYDSISTESILKYFDEIKISADLLPNAIILYQKKSVILPINGRALQVTIFADRFEGFQSINCGEDTIAVFLGLLLAFLKPTKLRLLDINDIITSYFEESIKNKENLQGRVLLSPPS